MGEGEPEPEVTFLVERDEWMARVDYACEPEWELPISLFRRMVKNPTLSFAVEEEHGPGGGWPIVRILGQKEQLSALLAEMGFEPEVVMEQVGFSNVPVPAPEYEPAIDSPSAPRDFLTGAEQAAHSELVAPPKPENAFKSVRPEYSQERRSMVKMASAPVFGFAGSTPSGEVSKLSSWVGHTVTVREGANYEESYAIIGRLESVDGLGVCVIGQVGNLIGKTTFVPWGRIVRIELG